MTSNDDHHETTPQPRDERHCGHPHHDHAGAGDRSHGRGMRPGRPSDRSFGRGGRPFGPGSGPRRPDASDEGASRERGAEGHHGHGRQRRLDRRILRTARIVAFAEHRAGRDAVERTMATSVSHADHEATMRTLRTIARAVRTEHLHGGRPAA